MNPLAHLKRRWVAGGCPANTKGRRHTHVEIDRPAPPGLVWLLCLACNQEELDDIQETRR